MLTTCKTADPNPYKDPFSFELAFNSLRLFKVIQNTKKIIDIRLQMWHSEPQYPDPKLFGIAGSGSGSGFVNSTD
jgi:hypothetical protein